MGICFGGEDDNVTMVRGDGWEESKGNDLGIQNWYQISNGLQDGVRQFNSQALM